MSQEKNTDPVFQGENRYQGSKKFGVFTEQSVAVPWWMGRENEVREAGRVLEPYGSLLRNMNFCLILFHTI